MKIAMIGQKGLPGIHGGVEKHVEELGARLVAKGHEVTVYCRKAYTPRPGFYRGMKIVLTPTIHTKHLDATIHTITSGLHASFGDYDVIHYHGIGPSSMSLIPRLFGKKVVATIHSLDYLRDKWGVFAKWALRQSEKLTLIFADRVITVSRNLKKGHADSKTPVTYIPNGVPTPEKINPGYISETLGLSGGDYLLWVGRFSPEKGVHYLIDAFREIDTDLRLVLAGGGNHTDSYVQEQMAKIVEDPRIIAPGFLDSEKISELYSNAAGFILPSEHEGLPVAMLEAMSFGVPTLAADILPCREIASAGDEELAVFFAPRDKTDLVKKLQALLNDYENWKPMGEKAQRHVLAHYNWDAVADRVEEQYEALNHPVPGDCPLCAHDHAKILYPRTRSGKVVRCLRCGFAYSDPPGQKPANDFPAVVDDPEVYFENAKNRLETLAGVTGISSGRLLDVGCFTGEFPSAAQRLGFEAYGVEAVTQAARAAEEKHGIKVYAGRFEDIEFDGAPFDVITFIHSFEHFENPTVALAECADLLAPGGALLIESPNFEAWSRRLLGGKWRQFIHDHKYHYDPHSLGLALCRAGFIVEALAPVPKMVSIRLLADRISRYYSRSLGNGLLKVFGAVGLSDLTLRINLGDIMLAVARPTSDLHRNE